MIVFLRGILIAKSATAAVIECNGIGYEALAPLTTIEQLPAVGEKVFLLTQLVVREDSQTLYGFSDKRARAIFQCLIKISGVGAKTALALMSALTAEQLLTAVSSGAAERLSQAPGIGKKTAERIIIDFRDNPLLNMPLGDGAITAGDRDVEQALAGLGYKKTEINRALAALPAATPPDTAIRLRAALQILSGR